MEKQFGQIFNVKRTRAIKLENSLYLEDLTGLLAKAASLIDSGEEYFFGDEFYLESLPSEPNNSYKHFISALKNSFDNSCDNKICIIRGKAGVGKTLFFRKGIQKLINANNSCNGKYISMGVDFKNIDNDKDVEKYEEKIYKQLQRNATDNIRYLGTDIFNRFKKENNEFDAGLKTPNTYLFPLKFFCEEIYKRHGKPCIIIFDNIDLASVNTQINVFKATVNVCAKFNEFMHTSGVFDCYRAYFAMRPETLMHSEEAKLGNVINFPLPNLLEIFLATMQRVLYKAAEEFDIKRALKCNVTCRNIIKDEDSMITLNTYKDVANYFYNVLNSYLRDVWNDSVCDRLGTSEQFHCSIVNYNVRMFLNFMADTISNGGFKPFTKEFNHTSGGYYNVFNYIEMIIRGRWQMHPGNKYIDGEGGNKAPIIFNVFDTRLYTGTQADKVKHFMLYIRILQYFYLYSDDNDISYGELEEDLKEFFAEENILLAIKKLTHIRFLYSFEEGDLAIAAIKDFRYVTITDKTRLKLSSTGRFYLEKLICEFEYLYQMSLSSLMCVEYVESLKSVWKTEKEKAVLLFLKSIFEIIQENIEEYKKLNVLESLIEMFYRYDMDDFCHPFSRMINAFVSVMKNKVQFANKVGAHSSDKLSKILDEAKDLEETVKKYFIETLGE